MRKLPSMLLALPLVAASTAVAEFYPLDGLDPVAYGFNTNTVDGWFRGYEF